VVLQDEPDAVISDPRVVSSYLGGDTSVIQRSGLTGTSGAAPPARKATARGTATRKAPPKKAAAKKATAKKATTKKATTKKAAAKKAAGAIEE